MYFAREAVQAGLRPTRTLWFEQLPVGESKSDCLKQGASAVFILSCFSPSSLSNSRKDEPEAGPLDSRLNIGWDKPSRRIQDFIKAVTSRNQQCNDAFHLNAEPASNSLRAPTRLPGDVTQQQQRFQRNHVLPNKATEETRTNPRGIRDKRIGHFHEATSGTNKISDLLSQRKASISNKTSITELWIDLYAVAFLMLVIFLLV